MKPWECPRCGKINAPWAAQCTCSPKAPESAPAAPPSPKKPKIEPWDNVKVVTCERCWRPLVGCTCHKYRRWARPREYWLGINDVGQCVH